MCSHSQEGGLRGLYKGYSASFVAVPIAYGVKFFLQDRLAAACFSYMTPSSPIPRPAVHSASGAAAATVAVTIVHPFDVVRRRMQLARLSQDTEKFGRNIFATLLLVYRDNGVVRGLYRGLSLNYIKVVPYWTVMFGLTDYIKTMLGAAS